MMPRSRRLFAPDFILRVVQKLAEFLESVLAQSKLGRTSRTQSASSSAVEPLSIQGDAFPALAQQRDRLLGLARAFPERRRLHADHVTAFTGGYFDEIGLLQLFDEIRERAAPYAFSLKVESSCSMVDFSRPSWAAPAALQHAEGAFHQRHGLGQIGAPVVRLALLLGRAFGMLLRLLLL